MRDGESGRSSLEVLNGAEQQGTIGSVWMKEWIEIRRKEEGIIFWRLGENELWIRFCFRYYIYFMRWERCKVDGWMDDGGNNNEQLRIRFEAPTLNGEGTVKKKNVLKLDEVINFYSKSSVSSMSSWIWAGGGPSPKYCMSGGSFSASSALDPKIPARRWKQFVNFQSYFDRRFTSRVDGSCWTTARNCSSDSVCWKIERSCCDSPQSMTALAMCTAPSSTFPAAISSSPSWTSWRKNLCICVGSERSGISPASPWGAARRGATPPFPAWARLSENKSSHSSDRIELTLSDLFLVVGGSNPLVVEIDAVSEECCSGDSSCQDNVRFVKTEKCIGHSRIRSWMGTRNTSTTRNQAKRKALKRYKFCITFERFCTDKHFWNNRHYGKINE